MRQPWAVGRRRGRDRRVRAAALLVAASLALGSLPSGGAAFAADTAAPGRLPVPSSHFGWVPGALAPGAPVSHGKRRLTDSAASHGEENAMYYGLGWDGSGGTSGNVPVTPFADPLQQAWDTTPCLSVLGHTVCSGRSEGSGFENLAEGVTGATAIAAGISDQAIENWIWAPYTAPPAGSTSGGGTWVAHVRLTAHVDTVLLANNLGALSDVGTDILDMNASLPYLGQETRNLGVGTYVDIDTSFLDASETSQIGKDIADENLPALLAVLQSALQSTVDSALGSLDAPPTTSAEQASDTLNALAGAIAGTNYDTATFTQTFTMPAGQSVMIGFSPQLMVANAGVGVTGAMAVSFVQLKVTGFTQREGEQTTLTVTPQHSTGVRYNYGSTSWLLPIVLRTAGGQPLPGQTVKVSFPGSDGMPQTWTCTTDNTGACQVELGPLALEPGPRVPVTVSFAGTPQDLASTVQTSISENPGPTALAFSLSSVGATPHGIPAGATAVLSASLTPARPDAQWGGKAPLGAVEFLADGTPVAQCALQSTASGAACDAVWQPALAGGVPSATVSLQAVWSGNLDWLGAQSAVVTTNVYQPGLFLSLVAKPSRLGDAMVCVPGEPQTCHVQHYGDATALTAAVYDDGQPTRGGYTVHFAAGGTTIGACETNGTSCALTYRVSPQPSQTTTYAVQAWVTGPGSETHPGVAAQTAFTYQVPAWALAVRALSPPLVLSRAPTAVGVAGPHALWVWTSALPRYAPDALWLVDTAAQAVVARISLPAMALAFGTSPDGAAWTVTPPPRFGEGDRLMGRWPDGRRVAVNLPPGFSAQALASGAADTVWVVGRETVHGVGARGAVGPSGVLAALLVDVPSGIVAASPVLPGSAGATTDPWAVAADAAGLWVATNPGAVVDWVTPRGATAFHLTGAATGGAQTGAPLASLGLNAQGQGWILGYAVSGAGAAWPIAGDGRVVARPVALPSTVNMVSQGVAVSDLGVGYLAFSAVGGGHGLPGIAAVAPDLHVGVSLLPLGALPGGGVGDAAWLPDGTLWAAVPFSHALFELAAEAPS